MTELSIYQATERGDLNRVKYLIEIEKVDINKKDTGRYVILFYLIFYFIFIF